MYRSYTMRLETTRRQADTLTRMVTQLCELYNMALQQRRDAWKQCGVSVTRYDQQLQLTELRHAVPEYAEFPPTIQRDALRRLDLAFRAFYRRIKAGQKPGYPRFKSLGSYTSFMVDSQKFTVKSGAVRIVGLGNIPTKTRCRVKGQPKDICIKRCGKHWTVVVRCDIGPAPEKVAVRNAVGIDLGLTTLATLSDGIEIENPRWMKREEERLVAASRALSRKRRGSKNRAKARERFRRVHQRIAGLRSSYLHGVSRWLVDHYDLIAHEDLKVRQMIRGNTAKAISDAAWGELLRQIGYKAEEAGVWSVPVNPRNTTQTCSGCGEIVRKEWAQRQHDCPHCGLSLGRDHNAALNILDRGVRSAALAARG